MMNNNLMGLVQMMRNGGNPMVMIQQMAGRDPRMAQAMNIIGGKSPEQLRTIAENMAKERGTSVEQVAKQLGFYNLR